MIYKALLYATILINLLTVSSILTAHQHILGYSAPENGVKYVIKERKYNQAYLGTIKCEKNSNIFKVKVKTGSIK